MKALITGLFAVTTLLLFTTSSILLDVSGFWEGLPWTKCVDVLSPWLAWAARPIRAGVV